GSGFHTSRPGHYRTHRPLRPLSRRNRAYVAVPPAVAGGSGRDGGFNLGSTLETFDFCASVVDSGLYQIQDDVHHLLRPGTAPRVRAMRTAGRIDSAVASAAATPSESTGALALPMESAITTSPSDMVFTGSIARATPN